MAINYYYWPFQIISMGIEAKWRRLLPRIKCVLSSKLIQEDERIKLAYRCASALWSDGRWNEAEAMKV